MGALSTEEIAETLILICFNGERESSALEAIPSLGNGERRASRIMIHLRGRCRAEIVQA